MVQRRLSRAARLLILAGAVSMASEVLAEAIADLGAWPRALERWQRREPGAWSAWRGAAEQGEPEAQRRLNEADALYRAGIAALTHGDDATDQLRAAAQIAPIDPRLYLPLARACRQRGAGTRAADFYRKYLAEVSADADRSAAEAELTQLGRAIGDPFALDANRVDPLAWPKSRVMASAGAALVLLAMALARVRLRTKRARVAELLRLHPERAAAVAYQIGVLRHELIKHRLAPLRSDARPPSPSVSPSLSGESPSDSITVAWHRHVDLLAAALGLPRAQLLADPSFRVAAAAMLALAQAEARGASIPEGALARLQEFDRCLAAWASVGERTEIDAAWLECLVDSLRDERPGRRLDAHVQIATTGSIGAAILSQDLLLVLRNLVRNAIAAASAQSTPMVRIETEIHVDDTGGEWVRVAVHDPSPARPPRQGEDERWRGLGLARATLERYGGALVELPPATGFAKALAASLPRAEPRPGDEQTTDAARRKVAA